MLRRVSLAGLLGVVCFAQTPTFHAGTRLVEVEVVVRGNGGPVTGLTRDDFMVLDQGKPQRIDVFRAGQSTTDMPAVPLVPGAVSNRVNHAGEALPTATVVLFDQLNTRLDLKDYERKAMLKLIRGLEARDRVAIYALGRNLHVLQEFTDDPGKLLAAVRHLDSGRDLMPANVNDALFDFPTDMTGRIEELTLGDPQTKAMYKASIQRGAETEALVYAANNDWTTVEALRRIVEHLSGMPGRRNLIWIKEDPIVPTPVMGMLLQSGIHLYPVLIRTVDFSAPDFMGTQRAGRVLAAATGGAGFDDAGDLQLALKTAEEDSESAYMLGYYPAEDTLDGKYHRLSVTVAGEKSARLEVRYRPGYLAATQEIAMAAPPPQVAIAELFRNPLDATGLGLTARVEPDSRPGLHKVRLTVDLHDVHLEREGNRSRGRIEMAFPVGTKARIRPIDIDLTDAQLAGVLKTGYELMATGVEASGNAIRVVVRDSATGVAGSLKIPLRP